METWEMVLDKKWRIEKWYSRHNEDLRNDIVYRMENWETTLSGI